MTDESASPADLSPERWETLEPLLDAALALAPEDRARFIDETCGSDAALRSELTRMLAACDRVSQSTGAVDRPAAERFASLWEDPNDLGALTVALGDRYTIEEVSGRGGMAVVYRARDLRHQRPVALKVLRATLSDHGRTRFRREIALAAKLQHPHILPVFDSDESAGQLWYTMPFVDGESLGSKLRRVQRLEIADAVRLMREIADGLAHAHAHGIVHRDLKPDNVLLSGGHAVIADFGIAKALDADSHGPDDSGVTIGTPAYMAPEQSTTDREVDHRADLYALGVVAYRMLTGVTPFAAPVRAAVLDAHRNELAAPVSTHRTDVPRAVEQLVMRLLEKKPDDRPQSAASLVAELDRLGSASQATTGPPPTPRVRRHAARWLVAIAATGFVAAGSAVWLRAGRADPPLRRVLVVPLENATGDTSLAYFGRFAAQWIAEGLSKTQFVDVASDIVSQPSTSKPDIAASAAATNARLVVGGSYFVVGDSIRARVQVHDVVAGRLLAGSNLLSQPRTAPNALAGQLGSQTLAMLATRLDPRIARWSMGAPPTNGEAYLAFIDGLDQISLGNHQQAIAQWLRAADLDSTYMQPLLHAGAALSGPRPTLSDSLVKRVERRRALLTDGDRAWLNAVRANNDGNTVAFLEASKDIVRAEPGAQLPHFFVGIGAVRTHRPNTALAAAKHINYTSGRFSLPWAAEVFFFVVAEAHHQLGNHLEELKSAQTARTMHPTSRNLLSLALRSLAARGDTAAMDSLLATLEGMPASPNGPPIMTHMVTVAGELAFHGHADASRRLLQRAVDWQRARPIESTLVGDSRFDFARALYFLGQYRDAATLLDSLVVREPANPLFLAYAAVTSAKAGNASAASLRRRLDVLQQHRFDRGQTSYARALVASQLGDNNEAIALLRQALNAGMPPDGFSIHADLMLSPVWTNASFRELLRPKD